MRAARAHMHDGGAAARALLKLAEGVFVGAAEAKKPHGEGELPRRRLVTPARSSPAALRRRLLL